MDNLLDFRKFPNEMISGLSLSQINEINNGPELHILNESLRIEDDFDMNATEIELFDNFFKDNNMPDISKHVLIEMDKTEESMRSKSSVAQEKIHSSRFVTFLKDKNINCDLQTVNEESLNLYLRWFYHELRTSVGGFYSPSSLKCIRAGIHRFLTRTCERKFNIICGESFASANRMLTTMSGQWLSHGGTSKQFIAIEENDLNKIFASFDRSSGESLQNEVLFSILYFLGARGREELRRIKRSDIGFEFDSNGRKYMHLNSVKNEESVPNNLRKNVKPSLKSKEYTSGRLNRIYDKRAVESIELYLIHINRDQPNTENLFPRPVKQKKDSPRMFSEKQVRGEVFLSSFMRNFSLKLKLSQLYTNHCIRCTAITNAKEKGLTNSDICLITGHKDERTINRYDRPNDSRKQSLCSALSIQSTSDMQLCEKGSNVSILERSMTASEVGLQERSLTVSAVPEKKMRIEADGNRNIVTITFE